MKLKILVLGSTGLIGHQVFNYLDNNKYQLFNISYRKKLNNQTILCDVRNHDDFVNKIKSISIYNSYCGKKFVIPLPLILRNKAYKFITNFIIKGICTSSLNFLFLYNLLYHS